MKKTSILLAAALTPLSLFAQNPAASGGGGLAAPAASPAVAPSTSPTTARIPEVQFDGETLKNVVVTLREQFMVVGPNAVSDPLNIVISPGLEERCVPALSLRNVTPTDVLSIATTVLGLRMEPVQGDEGRIVAWIIKAPDVAVDPFAAPPPPPVVSLTPSPAESPDAGSGGSGAPGFAPAPDGAAIRGTIAGGGLTVPAPVAIASSPSPGGGSGMAAPAARVFGVGPLLTVTDLSTDLGKKQRAEKHIRLMSTLDKLAADQDLKADIRAYNEMDIIVVKSADPAAIALIAEAIQAMKSNVDPAPTATGPPVQ